MSLTQLLNEHQIDNEYQNGKLHALSSYGHYVNDKWVDCELWININDWSLSQVYDWLGCGSDGI